VVDELLRGVQLLHRIQPPLRASELDRFREAFLKRYGDREVPLMEALDEESGIGFARSTSPSAEAAPLLEGIVFPRPPGPEPRPDPRESILVQRFAEASWRRDREIRLSEKDIADLEQAKGGQAPPLPDAFSVGVTLAAASDEALAQGDYRMRLEHVVGPSGAVFLGRFCHTDPELRAYVESHLRAEEALRPAAVFAEIVHLPEGRLGNVLFRPVLRGYEIPFLGRSGAPSDRQLPVTDLRLSVRSGRLLLRSLKLQREVVPRLTSALNTNLPTSQGAHRFLAALQTDGVSGLGGWPWGPLATAPFLPRVTVGRFVLSLATWRLDEGQLQALRSEDPAQLFASVLKLREELELPRHLSLVDGDNVLPLDLDNVLSVEVFARIIRRRRSVTLSEQFPPEGELLAQGPEGRFVHELIVPFVRRPEVASALCPVRPPAAAGTAEMAGRRCFPPGSEWLYAKLYTGTGTADQVLASVVTDVVDRALQSGAARGWFFIRYADPGWHLRLRIAGEPRRLWAEVLPALRDAVGPMLQDGRVSEFLIGTYEREVERYGGFQAIEVAEEVFRVDSEAVLAIVGALAGDEGLDARWRLTLLGVDRLLQDFGFDLEARADLTGQMRRSAAEKLGMGDPFWHQTGARFRNERRSLESLLEGRECPELLVESVTALTARSERLSPLVENLRSVDAAGHLVVSLPIIAMSYVHMHTNRMLQSAGPAQEAVIYDLLYRLYQGQLARRRG
jgi:thiopeptide-type bacteriocin biosynthesis protein